MERLANEYSEKRFNAKVPTEMPQKQRPKRHKNADFHYG
jgi:hypothetical protein